MTRRLVVDASAIVEVLRRTDRGARVGAALRGAVLGAPAHLDAEVLSALGRLERAGGAEGDAADAAIGRLLRLPVRRHPLQPLLPRAWELRTNVALRDALYVACAEALDATLVTLDERLARAVPVPVGLIT